VTPATSASLGELSPMFFSTLEKHADRLDIALIDRALRYSAAAHRGQKRMSGEDFVEHSIAVASILALLLVDTTSICAALLHDVVEDSSVSTDDIAKEFGTEVASLVEGLTKISHLTFRSSVEEQSENYRKLLLSVAKDARVIIIKLADRLHNMRTLEHLQPERRKRIATETREIYAPLAHRFGMANVKAELEDLAFKFLEADDYAVLAQQVAAKRAVRQEAIDRLKEPLEAELSKAGVPAAEVSGRPKHLWSIYQKMKKRNKPFDEIYDLMAMRVIVPSVPECYHVLGIIHHVWTPLQERIKDYIASPKSNGYQSLHTARRSSSESASKTISSSIRLMNSGLKVLRTSPSTMSFTLRAIVVVSADWNPSEAFFWMKRAPMFDVMIRIVFLKFTLLPRPSVR
jgi:GTP pyrophosphokinase